MATGDCYAVKLYQEFLSQECLNIWTYEQIAGGANMAVGLWTNFQILVLPAIAALQSDDVVYTNLEVFNIEFGSDYKDGQPTPAAGERDPLGSNGSSLLAFGFRSNRDGYGSRRSFKRFTGALEADLAGNVWNSTAQALMADVADAMELTITYGSAQFKPIQLRSGWAPGVTPTKNFDIIDWALMPNVTTQNSRKP